MRLIKLAGPVSADVLTVMPAAAFARGGGGHGGGGGGHPFVGGVGHASGGFTGRGFTPGFSGTRGFSTRREGHGRFGDGGYWFPYDPYDYSYLDYGPDNDYQYGDNSAAPVQPESFAPAVGHGSVVVSTNTGNTRPMDSRANAAYINSGYSSTDAPGQQRIVVQDPKEKIGPRADPTTFVPKAVPQPTQTAAKGTQTTPQAQAGAFSNLVLVSWLEDAGKDVIFVQNTETNDVQKITSEPNLDNFRIIKLHPNADPKLFEAIISNGSQQGTVRFRF